MKKSMIYALLSLFLSLLTFSGCGGDGDSGAIVDPGTTPPNGQGGLIGIYGQEVWVTRMQEFTDDFAEDIWKCIERRARNGQTTTASDLFDSQGEVKYSMIGHLKGEWGYYSIKIVDDKQIIISRSLVLYKEGSPAMQNAILLYTMDTGTIAGRIGVYMYDTANYTYYLFDDEIAIPYSDMDFYLSSGELHQQGGARWVKIAPNTVCHAKEHVVANLEVTVSCPNNNHPHLIDLGLPSGTKWACCNVGATAPGQDGSYFAWAETSTKSEYTISNSLYNGVYIGSDIAGTSYDAAHKQWGGAWQMPNKAQCQELISKTTNKSATLNSKKGRVFIGPNGKSIFLPITDYINLNGLSINRTVEEIREDADIGEAGYWTSETSTQTSRIECMSAASLSVFFGRETANVENNVRFLGMTIRPVQVGNSGGSSGGNSLSCPDNNHPHMIDLGLPSGTKWACCNVGATKPEGYGGYYAWGETSVKSYYGFNTYLYGSTNDNMTNLGSNIAGTNYDVAHVKWGGTWKMPTKEQCQELIDNTTYVWTTSNNVYGMKVTGQNGKTIFLPAAGERYLEEIYGIGERLVFYSATVGASQSLVYIMYYYDSDRKFKTGTSQRITGDSVRPVSK